MGLWRPFWRRAGPGGAAVLRLSLLEGPTRFCWSPSSPIVWNHLGAPISRENEAAVIKAVADEAEAAREGMLAETSGIYERCDRRSSTPRGDANGGPTPRS